MTPVDLTRSELLRRRLHNQHVGRTRLKTPADVVAWMGAVQSQDYPAAKWALGLRAPGTTDREVDDAFNRGAILRTHVLRPTWHFVCPADIRWMLHLTAPRVRVATRSWYRRMEIDERLVARANAALARALEGGRHATRAALAAVLQQARIVATGEDPLRLVGLFMRAELDAVICSGPRAGKQFTYALLADRVPDTRPLTHEEALAELAARYFESHGPATLRDFRWWSGLTAVQAKSGVDAAAPRLSTVTIAGEIYWHPRTTRRAPDPDTGAAYLLPSFDEALLSYRAPRLAPRASVRQATPDYGPTIVIDGRAAGTWRRTIQANVVALDAAAFGPLGRKEVRAVHDAAERYGRFMELPVTTRLS